MSGFNILDALGTSGQFVLGTVSDELNKRRQFELESKRLEVQRATAIENARIQAAATTQTLLQGNVFKQITLWTITGIAGTVLGSLVIRAMRG